jgi:hypothetical protein
MYEDTPYYDLRPSKDEYPDPPPRTRMLWIALGVLAALAAVAAIIVVFRGPTVSPVAEETAAPAAAESAAPLGTAVPPIELPPLDATDAIVRQLVGTLSSHPRIASWLATDGLIRSFTVVMANTAEGRTPAARLTVLRPAGPFRVMERGEDLVVDPASYARYDSLASAVASLDPANAARVFTQLKPRIQDAYGELGLSEPLDRNVERAIRQVLQTPILEGPVRVEPKGIGYGYADERLESLTPVQKQLLRLGPDNLRIVQRQVRAIAIELGIPADRLPR